MSFMDDRPGIGHSLESVEASLRLQLFTPRARNLLTRTPLEGHPRPRAVRASGIRGASRDAIHGTLFAYAVTVSGARSQVRKASWSYTLSQPPARPISPQQVGPRG